MTLILPDVGEEYALDLITAAGYTLRLFTNDVTAGLTSDLVDELLAGDFTEATFAGYAALPLTGGSWVTSQDNPSTAVYAQQTFTRSSTGTGQQVYGYYLTRTVGGALFAFEEFPTPITVTALGDAIRITPRIALDDSEEGSVHTGTIVATGRPDAPVGWLSCDGSAVSRTTYAALFAAIGTAYGVGDGAATFNLPDLQQRFPLGQATAGTGSTLGETGGDIDHVHGLDTTSSGAKMFIAAASPYVRMFRKTVAAWNHNNQATLNITVASAAASQTLAAELIGDSDTNNPPYQVVNYLIKT